MRRDVKDSDDDDDDDDNRQSVFEVWYCSAVCGGQQPLHRGVLISLACMLEVAVYGSEIRPRQVPAKVIMTAIYEQPYCTALIPR